MSAQLKLKPESSVSPWFKHLSHWMVDPLWLSLVIVLFSSGLVSRGLLTGDVIPFGDGRGFAQRAVELHGLLHSGQLREFIVLLGSSTTVTIFPTYLLFLLLPTTLATALVYGLVNCVVWHLFSTFALFYILSLCNRRKLTPAACLLLFSNNYLLDQPYYYYMDFPFMSVCLMALWLQARALLSPSRSRFLLAGLGCALVFFSKPGNGIIFCVLYMLSWGLFFLYRLSRSSRETRRRVVLTDLSCIGWWALSFLPLFSLALWWGAAQRIIEQIVSNQFSSYYAKASTESGILHALYFPLCLSFYYSLVCLAVLALIYMLWRVASPPSDKDSSPRVEPEARALVAIYAICFLVVWGEIFSFIMTDKVIRSIPLMLTIFWLSVVVLPPPRYLSVRRFTILALTYFAMVHIQFAFGVVDKTNRVAENYDLAGDWINRLPAKHVDMQGGIDITRSLAQIISSMGVTQGKVAVGTEMLYWNSCSLNWLTQIADLREGRKPALSFVTAVDAHGAPIRDNLLGSNVLLLTLHPGIQYSREVYDFNVKLAQHADTHWRKSVAKEIRIVPAGNNAIAAVLVVFNEPASRALIEQTVKELFPKGFSSLSEELKPFRERLGVIGSIRVLMERVRTARAGGKPTTSS